MTPATKTPPIDREHLALNVGRALVATAVCLVLLWGPAALRDEPDGDQSAPDSAQLETDASDQ